MIPMCWWTEEKEKGEFVEAEKDLTLQFRSESGTGEERCYNLAFDA